MLLLAPAALAGSHELTFAGPGVVEDTTLVQGEAASHGSEVTLAAQANKGSDLKHALVQVPKLVGGRTDQVPANGSLKEAWLTLTSSAGTPSEDDVGLLLAWAVTEPWDVDAATWENATSSVKWTGEGAGHTTTGHACGTIAGGSNNDIVIDMVACLAPYLKTNTVYGWALAFDDNDKASLSFASTDLGATVPELYVSFSAANADGDDYWEGEDTGYDCNDNSAAVNPGAAEIPSNGIDDDCNAATPDGGGDTDTPIDTGDSDRSPGLAVDDDGDRYADDIDCNDKQADIYPGHVEWCDKLDNNCNGTIDEDCAAPASTDTGCGCTSSAGAPWFSVLLAGTTFGRRRRR